VHPSSVFPLHAPGRAYVARRVPGARACSPHVTASRPWQILRMPHGGAGRGRPLLRATRFTRAPLCGRVTSRRSVTQRNARPVTASPLTSAAGPARRIPTAEPRSATSPPLAGKYRCTVHTWRAQLGLDFPLAHKKLQRTPSTSYPSGAHALCRLRAHRSVRVVGTGAGVGGCWSFFNQECYRGGGPPARWLSESVFHCSRAVTLTGRLRLLRLAGWVWVWVWFWFSHRDRVNARALLPFCLS
jgi:hypothetical protein